MAIQAPRGPAAHQNWMRPRRPPAFVVGAIAAVILVVLAGAVVYLIREPTSRTPARPELQRTLDALATGRNRITPGATAVVIGPHGSWAGSAGIADVSSGTPMQPDARMRLESVSKLWTATLVLRLVGERRMHLDDTVARWLPGLLPYGARITVRELLNHTSGIVDTNDITHAPLAYVNQVKDSALRAALLRVGRQLAADPSHPFPATLWIRFAAALPLQFTPGRRFHYSNIGYIIAGLIAQRASHRGLATLFDREIIDPLRLTHAAYDPSPRISGPHAQGYMVAANGTLTNTTPWVQGLGANGGIVSDAQDEARFLQALMSGRVLPPPLLTALQTPSTPTLHTPGQAPYGLGTAIIETGCAGRGFLHQGGGFGYQTGALVSEDGKRVAVLLLNGRTADDHGDTTALGTLESLYCEG